MTSRRQINIDALERANARLGRFVERYSEVGGDHVDYDIYHAAVVKGFEFTYAQAVETINRYIGDYLLSHGDVAMMSYRDIMRLAARHGLIVSPEQWFEFRERRNYTAHEYFAEISERVVEIAPDLHSAVQELLAVLHERIE